MCALCRVVQQTRIDVVGGQQKSNVSKCKSGDEDCEGCDARKEKQSIGNGTDWNALENARESSLPAAWVGWESDDCGKQAKGTETEDSPWLLWALAGDCRRQGPGG